MMGTLLKPSPTFSALVALVRRQQQERQLPQRSGTNMDGLDEACASLESYIKEGCVPLDVITSLLEEAKERGVKEVPSLHQLLKGSGLILPKPKPRVRTKEVIARVNAIKAKLANEEYRQMTKAVAQSDVEEKRQEMAEIRDVTHQMWLGVSVVISMATVYMVGWWIGKVSFPNAPYVRHLMGVLGAILIMMVEVGLLMVQGYNAEKWLTRSARKERRQREVAVSQLGEPSSPAASTVSSSPLLSSDAAPSGGCSVLEDEVIVEPVVSRPLRGTQEEEEGSKDEPSLDPQAAAAAKGLLTSLDEGSLLFQVFQGKNTLSSTAPLLTTSSSSSSSSSSSAAAAATTTTTTAAAVSHLLSSDDGGEPDGSDDEASEPTKSVSLS